MTTTTATSSSIIAAAAHGSAEQFALRSKRRTFSSSVRCALLPQSRLESRRSVSLSLFLLHFFSLSKDALGASPLDKYVKKKKLDPLEAYIPAVLLTGIQIREVGNLLLNSCSFDFAGIHVHDIITVALGKYLEDDQPKFADCRNLLRSGPASSFRLNVRAVAQYASDAGNGKFAFDEVDQCLRALEELDSLLLRASRKDSGSTVEAMKMRVATALDALDSLLKTVPAEVLDKGKAMADAYLLDLDSASPQNIDPQLQQLESIL